MKMFFNILKTFSGTDLKLSLFKYIIAALLLVTVCFGLLSVYENYQNLKLQNANLKLQIQNLQKDLETVKQINKENEKQIELIVESNKETLKQMKDLKDKLDNVKKGSNKIVDNLKQKEKIILEKDKNKDNILDEGNERVEDVVSSTRLDAIYEAFNLEVSNE